MSRTVQFSTVCSISCVLHESTEDWQICWHHDHEGRVSPDMRGGNLLTRYILFNINNVQSTELMFRNSLVVDLLTLSKPFRVVYKQSLKFHDPSHSFASNFLTVILSAKSAENCNRRGSAELLLHANTMPKLGRLIYKCARNTV